MRRTQPLDHVERYLPGGRLTAGVVRVGETVRRPAQPSSAFVAALLDQLARAGFDAAPRHLGTDDQGRDVLSYISGRVHPKRRFEDDQVAAAARLLRTLHDATAGSDLAGAAAVVCHGDPGPNNAVFDGDRPVAWIDFDMAAPGARLDDVAHLAWSWCISSKPDRQPATTQARQLRVLCDAYDIGPTSRHGLIDAVMTRQSWNTAFWRQYDPEVAAWSDRERAFTHVHREVFAAALA